MALQTEILYINETLSLLQIRMERIDYTRTFQPKLYAHANPRIYDCQVIHQFRYGFQALEEKWISLGITKDSPKLVREYLAYQRTKIFFPSEMSSVYFKQDPRYIKHSPFWHCEK